MSIILVVFLVKLIIDLMGLVNSLQGLATIMRHELEPTLKEFKKALVNINSITSNADLNKTINKGFDLLSTSAFGAAGKLRILATCMKQGVLAGLKVFSKK